MVRIYRWLYPIIVKIKLIHPIERHNSAIINMSEFLDVFFGKYPVKGILDIINRPKN